MRTRPVLLESFALAYWLSRRLLELLLLLARSKQREEVEILLLRHELQVLRQRFQAARIEYPWPETTGPTTLCFTLSAAMHDFEDPDHQTWGNTHAHPYQAEAAQNRETSFCDRHGRAAARQLGTML